jgi:Retroviral aspartyl protease
MLPYKQPPGQHRLPPYPFVWLRITDDTKNLHFTSFGAIIDTGADYTCIPRSVVRLAPGYDYEYDVGSDFDGNPVQVELVRITIGTVEFLDAHGTVLIKKTVQNLRLPIVAGEGLLGRDILNDYTCTLDGPNQICSLK